MKTTDYPPLNEAVTAGVRVRVETQYQFDASQPENGIYIFAYRIHIKNLKEAPIQLLTRHWDIMDCHQNLRTVDGEGVVGQKPVLESGEEFVYVSGCQLAGEIGRMSGYYGMADLISGNHFEVRIPAFSLEMPFKLN